MICTFIEHIIIFKSMHSHPPSISYQQAQSLLQTALHIIYQQNLANKHQTNKKAFTRHQQTIPFFNSPTKSQTLQPLQQLPSIISLPSVVDLEKILQKNIQERVHKFSTQESLNQANDSFPQEQLKAEPKDQDRNSSALQAINMPPAHRAKQSEMHQQLKHPDSSSPHLYVQSFIKQLKRNLEISSKAKICRSQEVNAKTGQIQGYTFHCKGNDNCPFEYFLLYTGQKNSKGQKMFQLIPKCEEHLKSCLEDEQEISFMKLTKLIDSLQTQIVSLLEANETLKPKQILIVLGERLGEENHRFIYKDMKEKNYQKAAKKYFDNLVYKVKCQMGVI